MDINTHTNYDHYIVAFSGGKDSLACLLHLFELGIDKGKIELWHHEIDGREGSRLKMDWRITPDYCRKVAQALDVKIFFSWKVKGFEGELFRKDSLTQQIRFETPSGIKSVGGVRGKHSTRLKFPQVSADLKVRWCSAYLKIDVCRRAIANQERFNHSSTVILSGERASESPGRAKYKVLEPDMTDARNGAKARHVDRWRPIHKWTERQVWDIIERWKINPHPCYRLGWGRCSCATCIFGSPNQWASVKKVSPEQFGIVSELEKDFGFTIQRNKSVEESANAGNAYEATKDKTLVDIANSNQFNEQIIMENWKLPAGAFGESCGPT